MKFCLSIYKHFTHLLSPPICAHCHTFLAERKPLCDLCKSLIQPIVSKTIMVTSTMPITLFALSRYQDPLKSLIIAKSFGNRVASVQLGQLLIEHPLLQNITVDVVVPIPLHWRRYAQRGYNQAEVMAQIVSKQMHVPMVNGLVRNKYTVFQSSLPIAERAANVSDVFKIKKGMHMHEGKHLLLIDDLITTGATMQQAALALLPLRPASITALAVCRAL